MAVVLEIIDLLVCRKIHGCGCFADDPAPRESAALSKSILGLLSWLWLHWILLATSKVMGIMYERPVRAYP